MSSCSLPSLLFLPFDAGLLPVGKRVAASAHDDIGDDEDNDAEDDDTTASALRPRQELFAPVAAVELRRPNEEQHSERAESSTLRLRGVELDLHFSGTS